MADNPEADIAAVKGELLTWKTCLDEDVRRTADERLTWLEGKIPALPSLEPEEEEEEEGYDDGIESDESDSDEDY